MLKYLDRRSNLKLALILAIYLILAVIYSVVIPIGRGADEWAHYWYAQFIAQNGRLPANPTEREIAGYKSDWPPLYHSLAAAVTGWIETDGPPTFKYRADNIRRQLVPAQGPDAILHTEDELFPWQQEILVWYLGRFLSISFSLGTLLVTYFIALEIFQSSKVAGSRGAGEQQDHASERSLPLRRFRAKPPLGMLHVSRFTSPQTLALASVAFLAFIPRFLFTGMLFNYDSLTLLLASLFLWLALRVAKGYYPHWGFWMLGGLAGLALLAKYLTALLSLEIILLAFLKPASQRVKESASQRMANGESSYLTLHASVRSLPLGRFTSPFVIPFGQAALAFLLVTGWWFGYLLVNFNEIDNYGPILGTLAPLLRGDGSDRTVEQIFALISGGQAPPSAHIETQSYTTWQIISEFPTTFWGNPITRPYPLNWFVGIMTVIGGVAAVGMIISWRTALASSPLRLLASLLLLHCLLPLPFMAIRLFGARDALEAVQGRHLLFLSGPAIAILLIWGLTMISEAMTRRTSYHVPHVLKQSLPLALGVPFRGVGRFAFCALLGLLLTGSVSQLIYMKQVYPPLLPVRTTPYPPERASGSMSPITLASGAVLIDYTIDIVESGTYISRLFASSPPPSALKVSLIWQAGMKPAPEDYRLELALVDGQSNPRISWLAYQTQAHYPTRAWETGDVVRDEGWLPIQRLEIGDYQVRLRLMGADGPVSDWQTLLTYIVSAAANQQGGEIEKLDGIQPKWVLWQEGQILHHPPTLRERETAQFTLSNLQSPIPQGHDVSNLQLIGPDNMSHPPTSAGATWANFIIGPNWSPGDYRWQDDGEVVLRVAENQRNFQIPAITHPLEANFEGQVKLLGYDLPTRRVQPGEGLPVTLYWQSLRWMSEDFIIFNRLLDNQGVARGGYDRLARENYSTLLWAPGEIVTDGFAVPIASNAPAGIYTLNLGWYRQVDGTAQSLFILNAETGQPTGATSVTIGPIKVGGPPPGVTVTEITPQIEVNVALGEQIKLLGFDLTNTLSGSAEPETSYGQGASGSALPPLGTDQRISGSANDESALASSPPRLLASSPLHLTLYWQTLVPPETDYTVFVHVRNAAGETVAQKDSLPASGAYPTSLWDTDEIIKDEISIPLEQVKPGQYDLVVGMYDFTTGLRLPVADSPDGSILLQSFEVSE